LEGIYNANSFSMSSVISGASIAVLSYLGFDAVTTMAEDSRVTGKMVGRGAVLALLISSFFYILQVYFATVAAPDFTAFESQDTAFFEIAVAVGGNALATVCTLIISVSGIATALAGQASASRVLYGMGRDGMLPNVFSKLSPRFKTPVNSILILGAIGYVAALLIPLGVIFLIMVFGALLGFICVNLSVIVEFYYRRKERSGKYVFSNLIFPLLGVLVCGYILIGMETIGLIVGSCWVMVGFIFLVVTTKGFKRAPNVFDV
jgi:putrescine importer